MNITRIYNQRIFNLPNILLTLVIVFRLALLIPVWQHPDRFLEIDSFQYIELARSLINSGSYLSLQNEELDLVRPPGYPIFLVPGLIINSKDTRWISFYQVLLNFATAGIIYQIFKEMNLKQVGFFSALVFLLNPNAVFWSMVILTETLAGFLITAFIYIAIIFYKTKKGIFIFFAGLILGYAVLTRPIIIPLFYIWIVLFLVILRKCHVKMTEALKYITLFILGYIVFTIPWQIRNQVVHDSFSISIIGQSTIEDWMIAKVVGEIEGISRSDAVSLINQQPNPGKYSLEIIQKYPSIFIKEQIRGILRTLLGAEYVTWGRIWAGQEVQPTGIVSILLDRRTKIDITMLIQSITSNTWSFLGLLAILFDLGLYGLCLIACFRLWQFRQNQFILLFGIAVLLMIIYLIITPFAAGESRFRVPADPILSLLAGIALIKNGAVSTAPL